MQNYEQRVQTLEDKEIIDKDGSKSSFGKVVLSVVIVAVLIFFGYVYNNIVKKEEQVNVAWSQVESNLQRKFDLLPNLVKVVKSYAKHERELFVEITSLRSDANRFLKSSKDKTDLKMAKQLQNRLDNSIMQLFAVAENYPQLKSSEHFLELQAQIEGSENRINITRMMFNDAVGKFNSYIREVPVNVVASFGGFSKKEYFMADKTPKKKFKLGM